MWEGGLYFSSRHKRKQLFKSWVCDMIFRSLIFLNNCFFDHFVFFAIFAYFFSSFFFVFLCL